MFLSGPISSAARTVQGRTNRVFIRDLLADGGLMEV